MSLSVSLICEDKLHPANNHLDNSQHTTLHRFPHFYPWFVSQYLKTENSLVYDPFLVIVKKLPSALTHTKNVNTTRNRKIKLFIV